MDDDDTDPPADHVVDSKISYRNRPDYLSEVVALCKISIEGIREDTKANELVGRRWLSMQMQKDKLRPKHIARILPEAVQMLFIPDKHEVRARQSRYSNAVLDRLDEYNANYTPRHRPTVWNWFGARRFRPEPKVG